MRVIVRMWTKEGYHKDVAILDEEQRQMTFGNMDPKTVHRMAPPAGVSVVIDPLQFPEATEFQVIVVK